MPSLFGMFAYNDLTSNVTRRLSWGMSFTFSNFLRKSCASLTYEGYFLNYRLKVAIDIFWNTCCMTVHWAYYWATRVTFFMYLRSKIKFRCFFQALCYFFIYYCCFLNLSIESFPNFMLVAVGSSWSFL